MLTRIRSRREFYLGVRPSRQQRLQISLEGLNHGETAPELHKQLPPASSEDSMVGSAKVLDSDKMGSSPS
jgi:hypothetical protein